MLNGTEAPPMPRRTAHAAMTWSRRALRPGAVAASSLVVTLVSSLRLEHGPRDHPARHRDDDEGDHEGPGREWRIGEQSLDGVRPVGQPRPHLADGRPELVEESHRHP